MLQLSSQRFQIATKCSILCLQGNLNYQAMRLLSMVDSIVIGGGYSRIVKISDEAAELLSRDNKAEDQRAKIATTLASQQSRHQQPKGLPIIGTFGGE